MAYYGKYTKEEYWHMRQIKKASKRIKVMEDKIKYHQRLLKGIQAKK